MPMMPSWSIWCEVVTKGFRWRNAFATKLALDDGNVVENDIRTLTKLSAFSDLGGIDGFHAAKL